MIWIVFTHDLMVSLSGSNSCNLWIYVLTNKKSDLENSKFPNRFLLTSKNHHKS